MKPAHAAYQVLLWCFRCSVWHCGAAPFPKWLPELDRRPPHRQRPRQRPGLRVQWHSGGQDPRWRRFRQPERALYDLCVDEARAFWQEEGDSSLQLRQNRLALLGRVCASVSTAVAVDALPQRSRGWLVTCIVFCFAPGHLSSVLLSPCVWAFEVETQLCVFLTLPWPNWGVHLC